MFPCIAVALRRTAAIPAMHPAPLLAPYSRGSTCGPAPSSGTATRGIGQIGRLHGVVRRNVQLLGSRPASGLFGEWPSQLLGHSPGFAATGDTRAT